MKRSEQPIRPNRSKRTTTWSSRSLAVLAVLLAALIMPMPSEVRSNAAVGLVLVLALDVSGSVDRQEFDLQRRGVAEAFRHPDVINAVAQLPGRKMAVAVVQWAGADQQYVSVPWMIVQGKTSAGQLSDRLLTMNRRYFGGKTDIAGLIQFATRLALSAPFSAVRQVIDISGDGMDNVRYSTHEERDWAVGAGLTINGLVILNETPKLDDYYRYHVIGGRESFVFAVKDYPDYATGIRLKLVREISLKFLM